MLVSWNWLKDYLPLNLPPGEVSERLSFAGLNHESTKEIGDDLAIDLEVTSNRPDCLGHLGIAREIAVLFDLEMKLPAAAPAEEMEQAKEIVQVRIDCPQLCPRYTARVIRGVTVGPSPDWLVSRLAAVGVSAINNVVDVTNYVLMESGQPLHAFDLAELGGQEIAVREAIPNEEFEAIDHKTYTLAAGMCVIADKHGAVALGGVMGGADTEVSAKTADLLIEAAEFSPLSIRNTARRLKLFSDSSYRFERGVDPAGVDWASRRCCDLILKIAGGTLAAGVVAAGREPPPREKIVLRLEQIKRVLGIEIDPWEVRRILGALGNEVVTHENVRIEVVPPSWRRDLTREIDLIEEVARIHGYDEIPEDAPVPMTASNKRGEDRVLERVRRVLLAAGFDEAMTASLVPESWNGSFSPWTEAAPLAAEMPMRGILAKAVGQVQADRLRRSLIPSLLEARRINESLGNEQVRLFESANVYLPQKEGLPEEPRMLGLVSGDDFLAVKGVLEAIVAELGGRAELSAKDAADGSTTMPLLEAASCCTLLLDGARLGFLGEVTAAGRKQFGLRGAATILEVRLDLLLRTADLTPQFIPQSRYPGVSQDLNFIVDESLRWAELSATVADSAGPLLESVQYQETYRNAEADGRGKKRLLLNISLRSQEGTLTGDETEEIRGRIVAACAARHGAVLVA